MEERVTIGWHVYEQRLCEGERGIHRIKYTKTTTSGAYAHTHTHTGTYLMTHAKDELGVGKRRKRGRARNAWNQLF